MSERVAVVSSRANPGARRALDSREEWIAAGDALIDGGTSHDLLIRLLMALRSIAGERNGGAHSLLVTTHQGRITQIERRRPERIV